MTCTIKGCEGKVLAKDLCAKHYMRQHRHGDPETVKKTGRHPYGFVPSEPGGVRAFVLKYDDGTLRNMSPRTRQKYWKWFDFSRGIDRDLLEQCYRIASFKHRPGFTSSTSKLEAIADLLTGEDRADWKGILDDLEKDQISWPRLYRFNADNRAAAKAALLRPAS
jgi:hypothetical protein